MAICLTGFGLVAGLVLLWPSLRGTDAPAPARAVDRLDLVATVLAYEIQLAAAGNLPTARDVATVRNKLPPLALADGRVGYVTDWSGNIIGATADAPELPRRLRDFLAQEEMDGVGRTANVGRTKLRDGTPVLVAVRNLPAGHVTVVQPYATARLDGRMSGLADALPWLAVLGALFGGGAYLAYRAYRDRDQRSRAHASRIDSSMSHGRCGMWDWDLSRSRVYWSTSMYHLLGYIGRGDHMSAGELHALLHPEDAGVRELLATLSSPDLGTIDREIRIRDVSGEWVWLRLKGETAIDPADGTRHLVGLAADVTAERLAAERRARDDLHLRDAVDALTEAFVLWDSEERLIVCNSKYLSLHGIDPGIAVPGTPAREIMAAARQPLTSRTLGAAPSDEDGIRREETQTSDGAWFHVSQRRTRDGGVVSVGTDVSELKRKEARLQARERHLRGSVRAAETAAQCFAAAAERNFEANQAKTEFLARVSHELRTPLNAIIGFSDMMRQQMMGPLDDRYVVYTTGIHASGIKLLEIIDAILQMSRIEKNQLDFAPEPVVVDKVVQEIVETVREDLDAKSIDIAVDIAGPLVLQADAAAMREILTQLIRNAVKFSLCDGRVRVRARSAGQRINLFVEDAGIGIPPEMLAELGRPFAQVEAEYNRSCGGAGLGLAITQALVEMHGGTLSLRSQPGTGTIALVSLPKARPAANDADAPASVPSLVAELRPRLVASN